MRIFFSRCPVIGCGGYGKRKMKPVRTVPEKFNTLDTEHKRFMVFRLRLPPSATKCCNNCFKKITKEIDSVSFLIKKNFFTFLKKTKNLGYY